MTLHIGMITGGPDAEHSRFDAIERTIARLVIGTRDESPIAIGGSVDLVFHVPGSITKPDYEGIRTGRFSRKDEMIQIQVSVPEEVVNSEDPAPFIFASMREAVEMAHPAFKSTGIAFSVPEYMAFIDVIEKKLASGDIPPPTHWDDGMVEDAQDWSID